MVELNKITGTGTVHTPNTISALPPDNPTDLCTLEDVRLEGNINKNKLPEIADVVLHKIHDLTIYIRGPDVSGNRNLARYDENNDPTNKDNYNAWKCCIYGTLLWMQEHYMVKQNDNIIEIREGRTMQRFSDKKEEYTTYEKQYERYLHYLMGDVPVGSRVHTPQPMENVYGTGLWWPP